MNISNIYNFHSCYFKYFLEKEHVHALSFGWADWSDFATYTETKFALWPQQSPLQNNVETKLICVGLLDMHYREY